LRFPISTAAGRALGTIARPSPFGRRDRTLYDPGVRDTWEIHGRNVKIDVRRWKRTLEPALARIRDELGLPAGGKLIAKLDKMLIYTPGQFFAAHQDSERADEMVASLVVQLPSRSSGGALIVHHGEQRRIFRTAARGEDELSLIAFAGASSRRCSGCSASGSALGRRSPMRSRSRAAASCRSWGRHSGCYGG